MLVGSGVIHRFRSPAVEQPADRATVAIDRVVERDGLIRLVWRAADGILVDSFIRPASGGPADILPQLERLCAAAENGENP